MKKIHSNMKMLVTIHSTQWENESIAPSPSLFHMMLILEWHIMEKKGHIFQFLIKGHDLFLVATATVKTVNSLKTLGRILESDIHVWLVLSSRHMATNIVHSLHLTATDIIHRSSSQPQIVNRFHLKPQTQCRTSTHSQKQNTWGLPHSHRQKLGSSSQQETVYNSDQEHRMLASHWGSYCN